MSLGVVGSHKGGGGGVTRQAGTISITSSATNTATINEVDPLKAVVRFTGMHFPNDSDTNSDVDTFWALELTDETTVTLRCHNTVDKTVGFEVIEYANAKSVQAGSITVGGSGSTTATDTINEVDLTKCELVYLGFTSNITAGGASPRTFNPRIALTDSTTVTATIGLNSSGISATVYYAVIEY